MSMKETYTLTHDELQKLVVFAINSPLYTSIMNKKVVDTSEDEKAAIDTVRRLIKELDIYGFNNID